MRKYQIELELESVGLKGECIGDEDQPKYFFFWGNLDS